MEETVKEDLKWLWAAYRKGDFDDIIKDDLDRAGFLEAIETTFAHMIGLYTIFHEDRAIGLVSVVDRMFLFDHYQEIHISWFSWATERNKIEGGVRVILELRKNGSVFIQVPFEVTKFVTHIAKYGILRRIGKLDQYEPHKFLYESMKG